MRAALRFALHRAASVEPALWLYRIRPTVKHAGRFEHMTNGHVRTAPTREDSELPIGQTRWSPVKMPQEKLTFVTGLRTVTTAGDVDSQSGMGSHLLFVTQVDGARTLLQCRRRIARRSRSRARSAFRTEFGVIEIEPGEICVIRAASCSASSWSTDPSAPTSARTTAAASSCRTAGHRANCLANPRDFLAPVAAYEDIDAPHTLYGEMGRRALQNASGAVAARCRRLACNYYPYKYDLRRFSPVGALLFDHPDPSILRC